MVSQQLNIFQLFLFYCEKSRNKIFFLFKWLSFKFFIIFFCEVLKICRAIFLHTERLYRRKGENLTIFMYTEPNSTAEANCYTTDNYITNFQNCFQVIFLINILIVFTQIIFMSEFSKFRFKLNSSILNRFTKRSKYSRLEKRYSYFCRTRWMLMVLPVSQFLNSFHASQTFSVIHR